MKHVVIKQSKDNQYYFIVKARNGQVLVTSETYRSKQGAEKGIRALEKVLWYDLS